MLRRVAFSTPGRVALLLAAAAAASFCSCGARAQTPVAAVGAIANPTETASCAYATGTVISTTNSLFTANGIASVTPLGGVCSGTAGSINSYGQNFPEICVFGTTMRSTGLSQPINPCDGNFYLRIRFQNPVEAASIFVSDQNGIFRFKTLSVTGAPLQTGYTSISSGSTGTALNVRHTDNSAFYGIDFAGPTDDWCFDDISFRGFRACPLPAFNPNVVSSGCSSGGSILASSSCDVSCASGYSPSGSTRFTCSSIGQLTQSASLLCSPSPCTLPSFEAGKVGDTCTSSGSLASGATCQTSCSNGYDTSAGTRDFQCSLGTLTASPTMTCSPAKCDIPTFGSGITGTASGGCTVGTETLDSGSSCQVECLPGFNGTGTASYTCAAGLLTATPSLTCTPNDCTVPSFGAGVVPGDSNPCSAGTLLSSGQSCLIKCDTGYDPTGSTLYTCNSGSMSQIATLTCAPQSCSVPSTFGTGVIGDVNFQPPALSDCSTSQTLGDGDSCDVTCDTGYSPDSGSTSFSCSLGVLTSASLQCSPNGCALPSDFGLGVEGAATSPCVASQTLASGSTCNVECASGFTSNGGTGEYTCILGVVTQSPNVSCVNTTADTGSAIVPEPVAESSSAEEIPSEIAGFPLYIIGIVIGGAFCCLLVCVGLVFFLVGKRRSRNAYSDDPMPSVPGSAMMSAIHSPAEPAFEPASVMSPTGPYESTDGVVGGDQVYAKFDASAFGATSTNVDSHLLVDPALLSVGSTVVGKGEYGVVFKGTYNGLEVAVKHMRGNHSAAAIDDFLSEARLMSRIPKHANVLDFVGLVSVNGGTPGIITEWCEGSSLLNAISHAPLNEDTLWFVVRGVCHGMEHLAANGICHRDLACRNILLTADWTPKVCDFGMSRVTWDPTQTQDGQGSQAQTKSDVGPIKWMAPESLEQRFYSEKSDVWMFGCTVLEAITTKEPFPELNGMQCGTRVVMNQIRPELPHNAPPAMKQVIDQCFAHKADQRPTFAQLSQQLHPV